VSGSVTRHHGRRLFGSARTPVPVRASSPRLIAHRGEVPGTQDPSSARQPRKNCLWAELMQRSFGFDVLNCPRCGGRPELIALIEDARAIGRILNHLGVPAEVPAVRAARSPPLPIAHSDPRYDDEVAAP
jgi:hypothetical protein